MREGNCEQVAEARRCLPADHQRGDGEGDGSDYRVAAAVTCRLRSPPPPSEHNPGEPIPAPGVRGLRVPAPTHTGTRRHVRQLTGGIAQ